MVHQKIFLILRRAYWLKCMSWTWSMASVKSWAILSNATSISLLGLGVGAAKKSQLQTNMPAKIAKYSATRWMAAFFDKMNMFGSRQVVTAASKSRAFNLTVSKTQRAVGFGLSS